MHPHAGPIGSERKYILQKLLAGETLRKIATGDSDFWQAIYHPYSQQQMTREGVLQVFEGARRQGSSSMPKLARAQNACDPTDTTAGGRKSFYRFKNFLYKTIRIS